jgi:hypothetical protein
MGRQLALAQGLPALLDERPLRDGEGGNRTHDTTIFSRVLYQLSYLAGGTEG